MLWQVDLVGIGNLNLGLLEIVDKLCQVTQCYLSVIVYICSLKVVFSTCRTCGVASQDACKCGYIAEVHISIIVDVTNYDGRVRCRYLAVNLWG